MMKQNWKASFHFALLDALGSMLPFYGVMALISLIGVGIFLKGKGDVDGGFMGYGIAGMIALFVYGIVGTRRNFRLGTQFGAARGTVYLANLAALAGTAVILAAALDVLLLVCGTLGTSRGILSADLYQLIYHRGALQLSFAGHLASIGFDAVLILSCSLLGVFFSLLFWRLSKLGCWIAGISIAAAVNLPSLLDLDVQPFWAG